MGQLLGRLVVSVFGLVGMLLMGVFFARIALSPSRRVPVGGLEAVYCSRAALFFVVGGVSQGIPYWAVTFQYPERFEEFMRADGFYSARGCVLLSCGSHRRPAAPQRD